MKKFKMIRTLLMSLLVVISLFIVNVNAQTLLANTSQKTRLTEETTAISDFNLWNVNPNGIFDARVKVIYGDYGLNKSAEIVITSTKSEIGKLIVNYGIVGTNDLRTEVVKEFDLLKSFDPKIAIENRELKYEEISTSEIDYNQYNLITYRTFDTEVEVTETERILVCTVEYTLSGLNGTSELLKKNINIVLPSTQTTEIDINNGLDVIIVEYSSALYDFETITTSYTVGYDEPDEATAEWIPFENAIMLNSIEENQRVYILVRDENGNSIIVESNVIKSVTAKNFAADKTVKFYEGDKQLPSRQATNKIGVTKFFDEGLLKVVNEPTGKYIVVDLNENNEYREVNVIYDVKSIVTATATAPQTNLQVVRGSKRYIRLEEGHSYDFDVSATPIANGEVTKFNFVFNVNIENGNYNVVFLEEDENSEAVPAKEKLNILPIIGYTALGVLTVALVFLAVLIAKPRKKIKLAEKIAEKTKLPLSIVKMNINYAFDIMGDALAVGESIEIEGFGTFRKIKDTKNGEFVVSYEIDEKIKH